MAQQIIVSILFCTLTTITAKSLSRHLPRFDKLDKDIQEQWYNRATSSMNAIVIFSLSFYYWFFINPEMIIPKDISAYQSFEIDFMMGYLIFDTFYEAVILKNTSIKQILIHHLAGLLSHYSTRHSNVGAAGYYSVMVHIAEISTPLIHVGWIGKHLEMSNAFWYLFLMFFQIGLYFVSRCVLAVYMLYHIALNKSSWGENSEILYWFNFGIVAIFAALNYFWFYKIIMILILKKKKKVT